MDAFRKILGIIKVLFGVLIFVMAILLLNKNKWDEMVYAIAYGFFVALLTYFGFYLMVSGRKLFLRENVKYKSMAYSFIAVNIFFLIASTISFFGEYARQEAIVEHITISVICMSLIVEELMKLYQQKEKITS